ncbi:MAG: 30S ribosomal protein S16 [Phycisphaera sp.]|nr:30S ribosomal protein S16 [Phycisphaera sp.]
MPVRLRLKRYGRRHEPHFRLCAMDVRKPRNGEALEELGFFNPTVHADNKVQNLNVERVQYWLSVGAQPSDTVRALLKQSGIEHKALADHKAPKNAKPKKTAKAAEGDAAPAAE